MVIANSAHKPLFSKSEGHWATYSTLLIALVFGFIFVARDIQITADDINYLELFSQYRTISADGLSDIFDEPIFKIYTNIMGYLFDPDTNIRILIFIGILLHALYALGYRSFRGFFYLFCYFFFVELAPHLSFVQLRQGVAIALMCFVIRIRSLPLQFAAIIACGLIHTSSLIMAPFLMMRFLPYQALVIFSAFFILLYSTSPLYLLDFTQYLGRRESVYINQDATYSYTYAIYSTLILLYVSHLFIGKWRDRNFLCYFSMFCFTIPMFFIPTFGAFAERFFFLVKWYELQLLVASEAVVSRRALLLYGLGNVSYTIYHGLAYSGNGGVFDRYLAMLGLIEFFK